jgi:predicted ATPase
MRIAISGTHRTGKSTLVAALSERLPDYDAVEEPYALLEEDGHAFAHPPTVEDFVAQLERSIAELCASGKNRLFDRSPVDFLAYMACHEQADPAELERCLPRVREALGRLDFLVFVPIEARDRIRFSPDEDESGSRAAVHEKLEEWLLDDPHELGVEVLVVEGDVASRARAVLRRVTGR